MNIPMELLDEAIEMFYDSNVSNEELDKFLYEDCSQEIRDAFNLITRSQLAQ